MFSYYNLDAIPIILDIFKVKNIVLTGELNKKTQTIIFDYCEYNAIPHILFNSKENILDKLSEYNNYSAIFLNDDANWYTNNLTNEISELESKINSLKDKLDDIEQSVENNSDLLNSHNTEISQIKEETHIKIQI